MKWLKDILGNKKLKPQVLKDQMVILCMKKPK